MENVGGIVFKLADLDQNTIGPIFKDEVNKFLDNVKEDIDANHWGEVFRKYSDAISNYFPRPLIIILLRAKINFMKYLNEIRQDLFRNCDFIEEITIPSNILFIGKNAFDACGIKKFKIAKRDTSILINFTVLGNIPNIWNKKTEFIYEGTVEECKKMILIPSARSEVIFKCSDGEANIGR